MVFYFTGEVLICHHFWGLVVVFIVVRMPVRHWPSSKGFPSPQPCREWAWWQWAVTDTQPPLSSKDPRRWWQASAEQRPVWHFSLHATFVVVVLFFQSNTFFVKRSPCRVYSAVTVLRQVEQLLQRRPAGSGISLQASRRQNWFQDHWTVRTHSITGLFVAQKASSQTWTPEALVTIYKVSKWPGFHQNGKQICWKCEIKRHGRNAN